MNKSILLYIGGFRLPDGTASAVRCIENAKIFEELGFQVVFIGKTTPNSKYSHNLWNNINGYKCLNIEKDNKFPFKIISEIYPISTIAAIITYNYQIDNLLPYWKVAKRYRIPFISDTTEWYLLEKGLDGLYRKLLTEYKMRFFNKKIQNHICSTRYIQSFYPNSNTILIPNVVDIYDKKWILPTVDMNRYNSVRTFLYAGSPGKKMRKDSLNKIIESFLRIEQKKRFELIIIGLTKNNYLKVFPNHRKVLLEYNNIVFKGRIPHKDVLKYIKSSDFTVLFRPNTIQCRVGFSTKIVESISCGIPIISNDVNGDLTLYLKENEQCLLFNNNIESMNSALMRALDMSEKKLEVMKKKCREKNPFDYRKFIPATREFLINANILKK